MHLGIATDGHRLIEVPLAPILFPGSTLSIFPATGGRLCAPRALILDARAATSRTVPPVRNGFVSSIRGSAPPGSRSEDRRLSLPGLPVAHLANLTIRLPRHFRRAPSTESTFARSPHPLRGPMLRPAAQFLIHHLRGDLCPAAHVPMSLHEVRIEPMNGLIRRRSGTRTP